MNDLLDVKTPFFEGPLDLLIHLIYKNEMNIYDISISRIADQFVDTVKQMESLDMEIAAEFIHMASYLTYLKSKMLLPKTSSFEEDIDPEEEKFLFTQKIIEYSFYKEVSEGLKEKEYFSSRFLSRRNTLYLPKENISCEDPIKLAKYFFYLINKETEKDMVLESDNVDTDQLIEQMKEVFIEKKEVLWSFISELCDTKRELVAAMFALLELARLNLITAIQNENFGEILVKEYGK